MHFLLVLVLCGAQSAVPELVPQVEQGAVSSSQEFAPAELAPNGVPQLTHELAPAPNGQGGQLLSDEPQEFMPPEASGNNAFPHPGHPHPGHPHPYRPGHSDPHQHGPHGPSGMSSGPGCMPGSGGCRPPVEPFSGESFAGESFAGGTFAGGSFAGDSFSTCPSCQSCPTGCQPPVGCPGCRPHCPLFGCWHLCSCCDPCTRKRLQAKHHHTTGDLYHESPYFPVNHGNYYFRPYHWAHVAQQQQIAATWGADPRAPYQSDLFCFIYTEIGIPLPDYTHENMEDNIHPRDRKPSDYFTTVP